MPAGPPVPSAGLSASPHRHRPVDDRSFGGPVPAPASKTGGAVPKELEAAPPEHYSIEMETAGLLRLVDERGDDRVHLYGHSAGASIALAFAVAHPDRVASLALDEPATDFTAEDQALLAQLLPSVEDFAAMAVPEQMITFVPPLLRPDVPLPPPPPPSADPEGRKRPAGLLAMYGAIRGAATRFDAAAFGAVAAPVLFTYGSLSNVRWETMANRLAAAFPDAEVERFQGLHHLHTSHTAEPARVAVRLRQLWSRS